MQTEKLITTHFKKLTDVNPAERSYANWESFAEALAKPKISSKKESSPAFSGAIYHDGTTRKNENVSHLTLAALDFDQGDPEAVCATLLDKGWRAVVVSSYSYTPEQPKFRVVLQPDRFILAQEWPAVFSNFMAIFPEMIDRVCKDVSRIYFYPSTPDASAPSFYQKVEGVPFPVDSMLSAPKAGKAAKKSSDKGPTIRDMADYALNELLEKNVWFCDGRLRYYGEGYWIPLSDNNMMDVKRELLTTFPKSTSKQVTEAINTLCDLALQGNDVRSNATNKILVRVNNGTLNCRTGKLLKHNPDHFLKWGLSVDWAPDNNQPTRFLKFLDDIWGNTSDFKQRVEFLQEWLGYLLYPSCKFERFLWLVGNGGNGKSVLLKIMAELVGQENVSRLMLDRFDASAIRAELAGKMLNISSEMNAKSSLADGYLKAIVSGEPIEADRKFKDSFTFIPTAKLVAATNSLPRLLDRSEGFARRATILTFPRQFTGADRDTDIAEAIIKDELGAILGWALMGLQRLLKQQDFTIPSSSSEEVENYRLESDSAKLFIAQHLSTEPGYEIEVKKLYEAFKDFSTESGYKPCNIGEFGRRITNLGIAKRESNGKTLRQASFKASSKYAKEGISGVTTREIAVEEEF